jgi:1-acyl-sn-glycerol-3-phosphate acyltransferase
MTAPPQTTDELDSAPSGAKSPPTGDYFSTFYVPTRTALWWLYNLLGGVSIAGAENIPKTGPAIIAPNHYSDADPPLIAITNQRRPVTIMAKESLFKPPVFGPYIAHLGAFPVKRGLADRNALRLAIDRLENGRLLLLFPEGQRGDGVNLQPPQRGLGMIAMKTGAPVIPTYIYGTTKMLPKGGGLHRAKVGVVYSEPILPQSFSGKGAGDSLAAVVMAKIAEMKATHEAQS